MLKIFSTFLVIIMRLSTKARYGVRAIFDIAYHNSGMPTQIKEISKRQEISQRYLEQIFFKLKKASLLKSKRGPKGGYYLSRDPEKISIGDIIRAAEGPIELAYCVGPDEGKKSCSISEKCITAFIWKELGDRIEKFFDSINLNDLCKEGEKFGIKREIEKRSMYFI